MAPRLEVMITEMLCLAMRTLQEAFFLYDGCEGLLASGSFCPELGGVGGHHWRAAALLMKDKT